VIAMRCGGRRSDSRRLWLVDWCLLRARDCQCSDSRDRRSVYVWHVSLIYHVRVGAGRYTHVMI